MASLTSKRTFMGALASVFMGSVIASDAHAQVRAQPKPVDFPVSFALNSDEKAATPRTDLTPLPRFVNDATRPLIEARMEQLTDPDWLAQQPYTLDDISWLAQGEWTPYKRDVLEILINKIIMQDTRMKERAVFIMPVSDEVFILKKSLLRDHMLSAIPETDYLVRSSLRAHFFNMPQGVARGIGIPGQPGYFAIGTGLIDTDDSLKRFKSYFISYDDVDDAFLMVFSSLHEVVHMIDRRDDIQMKDQSTQAYILHGRNMIESTADAVTAVLMERYSHDADYTKEQLKRWRQNRVFTALSSAAANEKEPEIEAYAIRHMTSVSMHLAAVYHARTPVQDDFGLGFSLWNLLPLSHSVERIKDDIYEADVKKLGHYDDFAEQVYRGFMDAKHYIFHPETTGPDNIHGENPYFHMIMNDFMGYVRDNGVANFASVERRYNHDFRQPSPATKPVNGLILKIKP